MLTSPLHGQRRDPRRSPVGHVLDINTSTTLVSSHCVKDSLEILNSNTFFLWITTVRLEMNLFDSYNFEVCRA